MVEVFSLHLFSFFLFFVAKDCSGCPFFFVVVAARRIGWPCVAFSCVAWYSGQPHKHKTHGLRGAPRAPNHESDGRLVCRVIRQTLRKRIATDVSNTEMPYFMVFQNIRRKDSTITVDERMDEEKESANVPECGI